VITLENEINELNIELDKIRHKIANAVYSDIADDKEQYELIVSKIKEYEAITAKNEIIKKENEKISLAKKENDESIEKSNALLILVIKEIDSYAQSISFYKKEFPNYIISNLVKGIEVGMNDFLDKTYDGRYHVKIQETKTGIEIVYGVKDADIARASGAEKNLFNVALKVAFTRLSGLNILILDEVDSYMSEEISKSLYMVLKEMIDEKELDQIFVISHIEQTKELLLKEFNAKGFLVEDGLVEEI